MSITDSTKNVLNYAEKLGIGRSLRKDLDPHAEPHGLTDDPSKIYGVNASTMIIIKDCADLLSKAMPGFHWAVQPDQNGGILNIFCLNFSSRWGYRIKLEHIQQDPHRREAVRAGREILERFGYHGTRYDKDQMATILRDNRGEAIPNVSGMKQNRQTRKALIQRAILEGRAGVVQDATMGDSTGQIIVVKE